MVMLPSPTSESPNFSKPASSTWDHPKNGRGAHTYKKPKDLTLQHTWYAASVGEAGNYHVCSCRNCRLQPSTPNLCGGSGRHI